MKVNIPVLINTNKLLTFNRILKINEKSWKLFQKFPENSVFSPESDADRFFLRVFYEFVGLCFFETHKKIH